jgi:hypothetical protein
MLKLYYCAFAAILGAIIGATAPASWYRGAQVTAQSMPGAAR